MNTSFTKSCGLPLLAALIATTASANTWERNYDFEFEAQQLDSLNFRVRDADIHLSGDQHASKIKITVQHSAKGGTEEQANEFFEKEAINCWVDGNSLIGENTHKGISWNLFKDLRYRKTHVTITCPASIDVQLASSDGNLEISNVRGKLVFNTSDGDVSGEALEGPIKLKTSDGNVSLRDSSGSLQAQTSDGDLNLASFSGSIQAQTSDGDINAIFEGNPNDASMFKTSDGDISLTFGAPTSLSITASVSDGKIINQLEGATVNKRDKRHQNIILGEGSIPVELRTSDGNIVIRSK